MPSARQTSTYSTDLHIIGRPQHTRQTSAHILLKDLHPAEEAGDSHRTHTAYDSQKAAHSNVPLEAQRGSTRTIASRCTPSLWPAAQWRHAAGVEWVEGTPASQLHGLHRCVCVCTMRLYASTLAAVRSVGTALVHQPYRWVGCWRRQRTRRNGRKKESLFF